METVLQQMLPLGIERVRRYDLRAAYFVWNYPGVPRCNAYRERKNGTQN